MEDKNTILKIGDIRLGSGFPKLEDGLRLRHFAKVSAFLQPLAGVKKYDNHSK